MLRFATISSCFLKSRRRGPTRQLTNETGISCQAFSNGTANALRSPTTIQTKSLRDSRILGFRSGLYKPSQRNFVKILSGGLLKVVRISAWILADRQRSRYGEGLQTYCAR